RERQRLEVPDVEDLPGGAGGAEPGPQPHRPVRAERDQGAAVGAEGEVLDAAAPAALARRGVTGQGPQHLSLDGGDLDVLGSAEGEQRAVRVPGDRPGQLVVEAGGEGAVGRVPQGGPGRLRLALPLQPDPGVRRDQRAVGGDGARLAGGGGVIDHALPVAGVLAPARRGPRHRGPLGAGARGEVAAGAAAPGRAGTERGESGQGAQQAEHAAAPAARRPAGQGEAGSEGVGRGHHAGSSLTSTPASCWYSCSCSKVSSSPANSSSRSRASTSTGWFWYSSKESPLLVDL